MFSGHLTGFSATNSHLSVLILSKNALVTTRFVFHENVSTLLCSQGCIIRLLTLDALQRTKMSSSKIDS